MGQAGFTAGLGLRPCSVRFKGLRLWVDRGGGSHEQRGTELAKGLCWIRCCSLLEETLVRIACVGTH
jgi:hypothetical protein